jgi:hypothetical protein
VIASGAAAAVGLGTTEAAAGATGAALERAGNDTGGGFNAAAGACMRWPLTKAFDAGLRIGSGDVRVGFTLSGEGADSDRTRGDGTAVGVAGATGAALERAGNDTGGGFNAAAGVCMRWPLTKAFDAGLRIGSGDVRVGFTLSGAGVDSDRTLGDGMAVGVAGERTGFTPPDERLGAAPALAPNGADTTMVTGTATPTVWAVGKACGANGECHSSAA